MSTKMIIRKSIQQQLRRNISTTKINQSSSLAKLKKLQSDFQADNGKPVWLKAGLRDRILYGITVIACYTGLLMSFATIYDNAKPSSWKKDHTC